MNAHGALYDQGLAFGGINGVAIKHIHGDGYWNQVRLYYLTKLDEICLLLFSMLTSLSLRGMLDEHGTLMLDQPTT